jgi:Mn-dependent DtxR family transcriptional regulator
MRTKDFVTFEPYRDALVTPRGIRHGSAFLADHATLRALQAR